MNYLSQSWRIDRRHALRAMGTCISLPAYWNACFLFGAADQGR